ncbi:hypothetical protein C1645_787904 [Glomus cerebriforme]|uniref:BAG domain-containing protein n=1 Tax=Glomus cerebriforme TaxID=658196 RepID=A0A397S9K7_9GLOM|nr:hypothetical protein C1645_787904 [Glomus cerebriforme]
MFAYYPVNPDYKPRSFYPNTRNFYHPTQYSPFYSQPEPFYYSTPQNYFAYDEHEPTFTANHQPKKSFKVKIEGDDDETKSKINKSQAAHKIYNFIKYQTENKRTRKILNKLNILGTIEKELKEIHETKHFGNLTFDEENGKQILPISIENKRFLEYENKIVKLFDKLDEIQSEGIDIIRERRKFIVKFAQTLLEELDNEKENQWKTFNEKQSNLEMVIDEYLEKAEVSSTINETLMSSENKGNEKDNQDDAVETVPISLQESELGHIENLNEKDFKTNINPCTSNEKDMIIDKEIVNKFSTLS